MAVADFKILINDSAVHRSIIGGGGDYPYIRVLPGYFLLKSIVFKEVERIRKCIVHFVKRAQNCQDVKTLTQL